MKIIKLKPISDNEDGLVAILVSVTFIIILSLITTSFAVLMRREQRQALDRQLSTQAFYAAESGINDAVKWLKGGGTQDITECNQNPSPIPGGRDLGDGTSSYSCLLVSQSVKTLEYSQIDTEDSTIARVKSDSPISKIKISWQSTSNEDPPIFAGSSDQFLPQDDFRSNNDTFSNHIGVLRASVTPLGTVKNRDTLIQQTQTLFMYPNAASSAGQKGTHSYSEASGSKGSIVNSQCHANNTQPYQCNVEISVPGNTEYYVRLKSIYQQSVVSISAENSIGDQLELTGAQALIDSTGKANDVLRRIQVRVPIRETYDYPEFTLESSENICKRLEVFLDKSKLNDNCII